MRFIQLERTVLLPSNHVKVWVASASSYKGIRVGDSVIVQSKPKSTLAQSNEEVLVSTSIMPSPLFDRMACRGKVIAVKKETLNEDAKAMDILLIVGVVRCRIQSVDSSDVTLILSHKDYPDPLNTSAGPLSTVERALILNYKEKMHELLSLLKQTKSESFQHLEAAMATQGREKTNYYFICDFMMNFLECPDDYDKQGLLDAVTLEIRLEKFLIVLDHNIKILKLSYEINKKVSSKFSKKQRELVLLEQMEAIKKELAKLDPSYAADQSSSNSPMALEKKLKDSVPPAILQKVSSQLEKLKNMPKTHAEYHPLRDYLELVANLPWNKSTKSVIDIRKTRAILDEDHHGLPMVKKTILQHLAVEKVKSNVTSRSSKRDNLMPILLLHGPPGVGKTSLVKSIARALDRPFVRISLGGVRDESEIRGHRRTYISALPGRIIGSLKMVGVNDPVILLDEIDKMGRDYRGDPAAALLEVLDRTLNEHFVDRYLEIPFDLSKIMFISTANDLNGIPEPLLDRLEQIQMEGYGLEEKVHIAQKHLIPKIAKGTGLHHLLKLDFNEGHQQQFYSDFFPKAVLIHLIESYTKEAGVRGLEREIASIFRSKVYDQVEGDCGDIISRDFISIGEVDKILNGRLKFKPSISGETGLSPGISMGLAYAGPNRGSILYIEARKYVGRGGNLQVTGRLGKVMRESCLAAFSLFKVIVQSRRHHNNSKYFDTEIKYDFVLHFPAGATPKDGPSAGLAILLALLSLAWEIALPELCAYSGEISLRERVLPVGGIREKLIAAKQANLKNVILPRENEKDLVEAFSNFTNSQSNSGNIDFSRNNVILVSTIDEAIAWCFPTTFSVTDNRKGKL